MMYIVQIYFIRNFLMTYNRSNRLSLVRDIFIVCPFGYRLWNYKTNIKIDIFHETPKTSTRSLWIK